MVTVYESDSVIYMWAVEKYIITKLGSGRLSGSKNVLEPRTCPSIIIIMIIKCFC